jgi:glycine cleavage system H protein
MAYLLVIATAVALATARWFIRRERAFAAARARAGVRLGGLSPSAAPSEDLRFHPGQTWLQVHGDGLVSVGATAFAANFAGELAQVRVPTEGKRCRASGPGLTLVSKSGRELDLPLPVTGRVLAVNPAVLEDPGLIQQRPYDVGWILRLRPRHLATSLQNLLPRRVAEVWSDALRNAVTTRLTRLSGVPAFDGGDWSRAFGEQLTDEDWSTLRDELFPTTHP